MTQVASSVSSAVAASSGGAAGGVVTGGGGFSASGGTAGSGGSGSSGGTLTLITQVQFLNQAGRIGECRLTLASSVLSLIRGDSSHAYACRWLSSFRTHVVIFQGLWLGKL